MQSFDKRTGLIVFTILWSSTGWAVPETINIQGRLSDANGEPLVGTRAYLLQFYDSPADGNLLGAVNDGFVTVSLSGRFSIELVPPAEVFDATDVYYALGIDSANPTDGIVNPSDVFRDRVHVTSVPFAHTIILQGSGTGLDADLLDGVDSSSFAGAVHSHNLQDLNGAVIDDQVPDDITIEHAMSADMADRAVVADTADTAVSAMGLSGPLSNPGDQIPLGDDVILQVGADGTVELLAGGARLRLARQKWFDPRNLLDNISPEGQDAETPQVALNNNGDAVIVWRQFDGLQNQIFRSEYRNGSWRDPSGPSDNISPDGESAFNPQVALNNNGEAVIVWQQSDGSRSQIFRSEYRNGSWTDPTGLSDNISPDTQAAADPQVALNDSGDAVIVWGQTDGTNGQIFRSEYRNGSWTDPTGLSDNISPDGEGAAIPQVALNEGGDAVIVWWQFDGTNFQIFRSEYRNESWTDPTGLSDNISPDGEGADFPQVAMNNNGDAVIVWQQSVVARNQIFRSEYRNGSWSDPTGLSDNISPDGQAAFDPQVALNDNGDAVIVWDQPDGANLQIFRSEYRDGSWSDPADLSDNISPNEQNAAIPQVALNAGGDAVIVWRQSDGANDQIFRSEYRNGSWSDPSGPSHNISPDGQKAISSQVALNDNGDAVIVWMQRVEVFVDQIFRSEFRFGF